MKNCREVVRSEKGLPEQEGFSSESPLDRRISFTDSVHRRRKKDNNKKKSLIVNDFGP